MSDLHKYAFDYRNAVLPNDAQEAWIDLEQYVKQLNNEEREECAAICKHIAEQSQIISHKDLNEQLYPSRYLDDDGTRVKKFCIQLVTIAGALSIGYVIGVMLKWLNAN